MLHLLAFLLVLLFVFVPFAKAGNSEVPDVKKEIEDNQKLDQKPKEELSLDDLLGPKDNFPFLPDNHRDAGTGKFNAF